MYMFLELIFSKPLKTHGRNGKNHVCFYRTNIKQKKYPAKLFYLWDTFFCKRPALPVNSTLQSDLLEGLFREPAYAPIGNPDFIPVVDLIQQCYFRAFM